MCQSSCIRLMTALTVASLMLLALPPAVLAIECDPPGPPADEYRRYDAVFIGKPTAILCIPHGVTRFVYRYTRFLYGRHLDSTYCKVYFSVDQSWKGVATTNTVVTAYNVPYGPDFTIGRQYLVYASERSDGAWSTPPQYCTRTTTIPEAGEDMSYLGPLPVLQLKPTVSPLVWLLGGVAGGVFFLLATASAVLMSRRAGGSSRRKPIGRAG
jgi:hypothetical protein